MKIFFKIAAILMLFGSFTFTACDGGSINGEVVDSVITIAVIPGVVIPVVGAVSVTTEINTEQYTGTITWSPAGNSFAASTEYTANIVLTAKDSWTLTGVAENFFKVAGATATNAVDTGNITAEFPATGSGSDTAVTLTGVTANGTSNTVNTTALTLSFSVNPASLTSGNIMVSGATKGALTGTGTTRTLAISAITVANGATITVAVASPAGYAITASPKTVVVYRAPDTSVTFSGVTQSGGTSGTVTTTALILTFSADPTTLTVGYITVTGAKKGDLTGTGLTRTLNIYALTVANGATVSVAVSSPAGYAITGTPKTAVIYRAPYFLVTYNAGTGNTSGTVPVDETNYESGQTVIVLDNINNLAGEIITGTIKRAFLGWNTNPAATEAQYRYNSSFGGAFTITADTTLYAVYTALRVTGPAGGLIFYDAGSTQAWGRYLEAAPADISIPAATLKWKETINSTVGTGTAVGTGAANSIALAGVSHPAAEACRNYSYGGYGAGSWFLPSKDELWQMCWNLMGKKYIDGATVSNQDVPYTGPYVGLGGLEKHGYWSSSQDDSVNAWYQDFSNGWVSSTDKRLTFTVRAIRAF